MSPAGAAAPADVTAVPDRRHGPTINLAAVVEQNPLLAVSVAESALRVWPAYSGPPAAGAAAALTSCDRMQHASTTSYAAAVALPVLAKVIAARVAPPGYCASPQHVASSAAAATARAAACGPQAATAPAAAAGASSDTTSKLEQKMFCLLLAAVKYAQVCAARTERLGFLGVPEQCWAAITTA